MGLIGTVPTLATYAGSACNGHTHATLSGCPTESVPSAPTGATTTWVTKCASETSSPLRRSTSTGNTPLSPSPDVGYVSTRCPVAGSVGSASNGNVWRARVVGRLSPLMLLSNPVRDCRASCTVSATCAPGGTAVGVEAHHEVGARCDPRALPCELERRCRAGARARSRALRRTRCRGHHRGRHHGAHDREPGDEERGDAAHAGRHNERPSTHRPAGRISNPNDWYSASARVFSSCVFT